MTGQLTTKGEVMALNTIFTATAVTRPTAWFVALHAGANGGQGTSAELTGLGGYARQPCTFSLTGNTVSNSTALTFGPDTATPWGSVTDISIWDALTAGNCLAAGTTSAAVTYAIGDSATVAVGQLSVQLN